MVYHLGLLGGSDYLLWVIIGVGIPHTRYC